jgi:hypothetical protein
MLVKQEQGLKVLSLGLYRDFPQVTPNLSVSRYGSIGDSRFENHPLASEIPINSRGQSALSHRIEAAYAVMSAASAYH